MNAEQTAAYHEPHSQHVSVTRIWRQIGITYDVEDTLNSLVTSDYIVFAMRVLEACLSIVNTAKEASEMPAW